MKNMLRLLIALGFVWGVTAHATVIYENGATVNNAVFSDPNTPQFIADDFRLSHGLNSITEIRWTGVYAPNASTVEKNFSTVEDNFWFQLFADVSGAPALTPMVSLFVGDPGRTDINIDIFSNDLFEYSVTIAPIIVTPDTTFWLSIINDTSNNAVSNWAWASQSFDFGGGNLAQRTSEGSSWFLSSSFVQDLTISGPVGIPEPAPMVLLALGFVGLIGYRKLQDS